MIIWKGLGILIPLFALGGALVGFAVNSMVLSFWLAAGGVWVFALTLGKTKVQTFQDPQTGQPVVFKRSHTLYFIPPVPWAVVATGFALLMTLFAPVVQKAKDREKSPFQQADAMIATKKEGPAHGNTPEAVALARRYSEQVQAEREMAITKGKLGISLSGGDFLTYAHVTSSHCVFLVHVPQLRKFTAEAKEAMAQIAWVTAQRLAADLKPKPGTLAVGIRGSVLYERALIGRVMAPDGEAAEAIEQEVDGSDVRGVLAAFFDAEPAAPEVASSPPPPADARETAAEEAPSAPAEAAPTSAPAAATAQAVPASAPPAPSISRALPTDLRDWKSADGRTLRAALIQFTDGERKTAELRREDGQVFQVPVERFSAEDQAFMHSVPAE